MMTSPILVSVSVPSIIIIKGKKKKVSKNISEKKFIYSSILLTYVVRGFFLKKKKERE